MEIKVFLNRQADKPCYQRIVSQNSAVTQDFNLLLQSMRILYGPQCVVHFVVFD